MKMVLARRLMAEFSGTGLLVAVVVGSGIAASRLTSDGALRLLVCSLVTGIGLAVLIVVFVPVGQIMQCLQHQHRRRDLTRQARPPGSNTWPATR